MSYICSIGTSLPEYQLSQEDVKVLVSSIFQRPDKEIKRLLPVFDHANINNRQFVVPKAWFTNEHTFTERNNLYQQKAVEHSINAIDLCLSDSSFLTNDIPYHAIDAIIYVSSTGIATPSIDAYILNQRRFREDVVRLPLWGLGCAGGTSGLARAHEWLESHPTGTVLVVCVELCSLTFQKQDTKKSNFIGTALFGDGISAALLVGNESPYLHNRKHYSPKIQYLDSRLLKDSLQVMGWDISTTGFEVIFAKSIPRLVETFWKEHIFDFLHHNQISREDISYYMAHPGGTRVLQAMQDVLHTNENAFYYSYQVLRDHGNMSSATILYVLQSWMKSEEVPLGEKSIISALGPGFSSELLSVEWS